MERWEYKIVNATFGAELEQLLNHYGYDGWRVESLAAMNGTLTLTGNKMFAVLRRELPADAPRPAPHANTDGWL